MRIELLPSNIAALPDRNIPDAGEELGDPGNSIFLDVVAQIAAATGCPEGAFPEDAAAPGEGVQAEGSGEATTAASQQPVHGDPVPPKPREAAVPDTRSGSRMWDLDAADSIAAIPVAALTAPAADQAASDCTPMAAGGFSFGESGTDAIPLLPWPSLPAPASQPRNPAADSQETAVVSATLTTEEEAVDGKTNPTGEKECLVSGGTSSHAVRTVVPGRGWIWQPAIPAPVSPLSATEGAGHLNRSGLPSGRATAAAGTPTQTGIPAKAFVRPQPWSLAEAFPASRSAGVAVGSAQPPFTIPETFRAVSAGVAAAPSALPDPKVLSGSSRPEGVAAESNSGALPPDGSEGPANIGEPAVDAEGIGIGHPRIALPESGRRYQLPHAAAEKPGIAARQTESPEELPIDSARAALVEGSGGGRSRVKDAEAFHSGNALPTVPGGLGAGNRRIASHESPASGRPQDATAGGSQRLRPESAAPESLPAGYRQEPGIEPSQGSGARAAAAEPIPMRGPQTAEWRGEEYADLTLSQAALRFLRVTRVSVGIAGGSAPSSEAPEAARPSVLYAPLMAGVEREDLHQPKAHSSTMPAPSDAKAPTAVEQGSPACRDIAETVLPEPDGAQPLPARLVLNLSADAAEAVPDLAVAQTPLPAGGGEEPPAKPIVPASFASSAEDPVDAAGRADLPTVPPGPDLEIGQDDPAGVRPEDDAATPPETRLQPHRRQARESWRIGILRREPVQPDSVRQVTPTAASGAGLPNDSGREGGPRVSFNRLPAGDPGTTIEAGMDEQAAHPFLQAEKAAADPKEAPALPNALAPDASGRTNSSAPAAHAAPRPVQNTVTAVPGAALPQPSGQAAGTDAKALAALLAPKSQVPSQEPDFLSQLAARIQMQLRESESTMRIQLRPATLGRMEIKAETTARGVAAIILTESSSVKTFLENNLHILQQNFQDQGLRIDRIQVAVQEGFSPHHPYSGNQESRSGAGQQESAERGSWSRNRLEVTAEEIALDAHTLALMNPHHTFHTVA